MSYTKEQMFSVRSLVSRGYAVEDVSERTGVSLEDVCEKVMEWGYPIRRRNKKKEEVSNTTENVVESQPKSAPAPEKTASEKPAPATTVVRGPYHRCVYTEELCNKVEELRKKNYTQKAIAQKLGITTNQVIGICSKLKREREIFDKAQENKSINPDVVNAVVNQVKLLEADIKAETELFSEKTAELEALKESTIEKKRCRESLLKWLSSVVDSDKLHSYDNNEGSDSNEQQGIQRTHFSD